MAESGNVQSNVSEVADERLQQKVEVTVGDLQVVANIIRSCYSERCFQSPRAKGVGGVV